MGTATKLRFNELFLHTNISCSKKIMTMEKRRIKREVDGHIKMNSLDFFYLEDDELGG